MTEHNGTSRPISACQACGAAPLRSILFLGYVPPVNTMPPIGSAAEEQPAYPLEMLRCESCGLVQIGLEVDPGILFPPSYPYRSRSTRVLRENFDDLYEQTAARFGLGPQTLVVDIGSNDGTLLSRFHDKGVPVLGVEPSDAAEDARAAGIRTWTDFFGAAVAERIREEIGPATLVTAANVFAHIGDVHGVLDGITALLSEDGVFVSENHDLLSLIETLQYDTIYHEHLRYYHVAALQPMLARHGLEIFDVQPIPTHGGSIRVFSGREGRHAVRESVAERIAAERAAGLIDGQGLDTFSAAVLKTKLDLCALFAEVKRTGAKIYGIGAPSRASTLINYVGIDAQMLDCVLEIDTSPKVGHYIPGTRIPVLEESKLFADQPDYALLLSWHISDDLIANLRRKGFSGKFIAPLPSPRVL